MPAKSRPLWANYIVAYFVIGFGATVFDAASGPRGNRLFSAIGGILCGCGVLIFLAAMSNSVRIVMTKRRHRPDLCTTCGYDLGGNVSDACPKCGSKRQQCDTCGYNLTANVSGVCPECGNKVPA